MSTKILIADDIATNRLVLKVKLLAARYEVLTAETSDQVYQIAADHVPDLIIMDVEMMGRTGVEICRKLRDDPQTRDIAVILFSSHDEQATRIEGLSAGADDFMSKPISDITLLARIRSLLRNADNRRELRKREQAIADLGALDATPVSKPRIAVVGSKRSEATAMSQQLADELGYSPSIIEECAALELKDAFDVYLISIDLLSPNAGIRLMSDLLSRPLTQNSRYIISVQNNDSARAATALDLGAHDICYIPFSARETSVRIKAQLARKRRAERVSSLLDNSLRMAAIDPLTGLQNRRTGLNKLHEIADQGKAAPLNTVVIIADIDDFKTLNDAQGHHVGDQVLKDIAQTFQRNLRDTDIASRIGGEEFLIVLPNTTLEMGRTIAERLRKSVENMQLSQWIGEHPKISMSLGLTTLDAHDNDVDTAMIAADKALYSAKAAGRNAVFVVSA